MNDALLHPGHTPEIALGLPVAFPSSAPDVPVFPFVCQADPRTAGVNQPPWAELPPPPLPPPAPSLGTIPPLPPPAVARAPAPAMEYPPLPPPAPSIVKDPKLQESSPAKRESTPPKANAPKKPRLNPVVYKGSSAKSKNPDSQSKNSGFRSLSSVGKAEVDKLEPPPQPPQDDVHSGAQGKGGDSWDPWCQGKGQGGWENEWEGYGGSEQWWDAGTGMGQGKGGLLDGEQGWAWGWPGQPNGMGEGHWGEHNPWGQQWTADPAQGKGMGMGEGMGEAEGKGKGKGFAERTPLGSDGAGRTPGGDWQAGRAGAPPAALGSDGDGVAPGNRREAVSEWPPPSDQHSPGAVGDAATPAGGAVGPSGPVRKSAYRAHAAQAPAASPEVTPSTAVAAQPGPQDEAPAPPSLPVAEGVREQWEAVAEECRGVLHELLAAGAVDAGNLTDELLAYCQSTGPQLFTSIARFVAPAPLPPPRPTPAPEGRRNLERAKLGVRKPGARHPCQKVQRNCAIFFRVDFTTVPVRCCTCGITRRMCYAMVGRFGFDVGLGVASFQRIGRPL